MQRPLRSGFTSDEGQGKNGTLSELLGPFRGFVLLGDLLGKDTAPAMHQQIEEKKRVTIVLRMSDV